MLFSFGHGQHILIPTDGKPEGKMPAATKALRSVAPGANMGDVAESGVEAGLSGTDVQSFGYMFPDGAGVPGEDAATVDALIALATAMVEDPGDPAEADSSIAPIMTYFANNMGLYDVVGNVAEMTNLDGIAMGGSWNHPAEESTITSINRYEGSDISVGIRLFMEVIEK